MIVMAKNKSDQKRRIENVLSALKHDKLAIASLVFLVIIIALALLAPILPLDPNTTDVRNMFQPPSPEHWFGTDDIGRDYLSRVIYGGRVSLLVGFLAMITCVCVGVLVGTFPVLRRMDRQYPDAYRGYHVIHSMDGTCYSY